MEDLHFVLFPFMAQGHMIPMVDMARLLSKRGVVVTMITTPGNAARFERLLARATESGLRINLVKLQIPFKEAGIPEGCENLDMISEVDIALKFMAAVNALGEQVEKLFEQLTPTPSCIITDAILYYTSKIAKKFRIPRICFRGYCSFATLCLRNVHVYNAVENRTDSDFISVPGLSEKIEFKRPQLPVVTSGIWNKMANQMMEAEEESYGVVINTFEELEHAYIEEYKRVTQVKVWCIGPVSLTLDDEVDKVERGNKASVDKHECLRWLDSQATRSVVFACLGSLCNLTKVQFVELALGLEATNRPFIMVIRGSEKSKGLEEWISEEGFEERTKGRGFLIRGWAPQLLILSHPTVGGFLTHCGWNSTLEGISAGLPLLTWPLFGDQFCNERLVTDILKIGVRIGVDDPNNWGQEEQIGVLVKKDDVKSAVEKLMDEGEEAKERRKRAKEYGEMAKRAVEVGGSSHNNITLLIQDILQL